MSRASAAAARRPNSGWALMPVPTAVPQRQLRQPGQDRLDAGDGVVRLAGPGADLLPQPHGHGVHEMGAAGFHHVVERDGAPVEDVPQVAQRRHSSPAACS